MKPQFHLRTLLLAPLAVPICSGCCSIFGLATVAIAIATLFALTGWVILLHIAPIATKYFTVFAILGLIGSSFVWLSLVRSHEEAWRMQTLNQIRKMAVTESETDALFPGEEKQR